MNIKLFPKTAYRSSGADSAGVRERDSNPEPLFSRGKTLDELNSHLLNYVYAVAAVISATAIFYLLRGHLDREHDVSLLFLPVVIACAVRLGFGPAVVASFLGFIIWDFFFIPPRFTLNVARPDDCIALITFLFAAGTTAQLTSRMRQKADEAQAREREIATLFQIGQIVSSEVDSDRLLYTLADQIARTCRATRCIVYRIDEDAVLSAAAAVTLFEPLNTSNSLMHRDAARALDEGRIVGFAQPRRSRSLFLPAIKTTEPGICPGIFVPLRYQDVSVGVLHIGPRQDGEVLNPRDRDLVLALGNFTAAVIARQNLADETRQQMQNAAIHEERNRLAREIHDTLAQGLTGIVIQLQAADGGNSADQYAAVDQARRLAQECLTEARRSVKALRPGALEELDLRTALSEMLMKATRKLSVQALSRTSGTPYALPIDIESNLLRIGQEAVTNAIRHSDAETIEIVLTYEPSQVALLIQDDGIGFDEPRLSAAGFGLTSMRERAVQIGATLEIATSAGKGAIITVTLPVSNENPKVGASGPTPMRFEKVDHVRRG